MKTLESQVQNGEPKMDTLLKTLEAHAGKEINGAKK